MSLFEKPSSLFSKSNIFYVKYLQDFDFEGDEFE